MNTHIISNNLHFYFFLDKNAEEAICWNDFFFINKNFIYMHYFCITPTRFLYILSVALKMRRF